MCVSNGVQDNNPATFELTSYTQTEKQTKNCSHHFERTQCMHAHKEIVYKSRRELFLVKQNLSIPKLYFLFVLIMKD